MAHRFISSSAIYYGVDNCFDERKVMAALYQRSWNYTICYRVIVMQCYWVISRELPWICWWYFLKKFWNHQGPLKLSTPTFVLTRSCHVVICKYLRARINHKKFTNMKVNWKKHQKSCKTRTKVLPLAESVRTVRNKLKLLLNLTCKGT